MGIVALNEINRRTRLTESVNFNELKKRQLSHELPIIFFVQLFLYDKYKILLKQLHNLTTH